LAFTTYDILIALDVQSRGGGVLGVLSRDIANAASGVRTLGAAFSDTTRLAQQAATAQNALAAATARLSAEQKAQSALLSSGVGVAASDMEAYTAAQARHQVAADASTAANARLAASMAGPGAALAGLGGLGVTAAVAGGALAAYGAYSAVRQSMAYHQQVADIVAQTTMQPQDVAPLAAGVLRLVGQRERYSPQQILTALYPLLSSGAFTAANVLPALRTVVTQAQPAGAAALPTLGLADVAALQGFGLKVSQFGAAVDVISKGVAVGQAETAAYARGLGTFAQSAAKAGVTLADAAGAYAQQTRLSPRFLLDAQQLNALFYQVRQATQPARGARVEAALGISGLFGPGAIGRAGGLPAWLEQLQTATAGPYQQQLLQAMFANKAAATSLSGMIGTNLVPALGVIAQLQQSRGATAAAGAISTSQLQSQLDSLGARWSRDTIAMGDAMTHLAQGIGTTLAPAFVLLAGGALTAAEALGKVAGTAGGQAQSGFGRISWPRVPGLPTIGMPDTLRQIQEAIQHGLPGWLQTAFGNAPMRPHPAPSLASPVPGALGPSGMLPLRPGEQPALATARGPVYPETRLPSGRTYAQTVEGFGEAAARAYATSLYGAYHAPAQPASGTLAQLQAAAGLRPSVPTTLAEQASAAATRQVDEAARLRRQQAALAAITGTHAARAGAHPGLTGPELIRPADRGIYDPLALFAQQRATWGSSIVQLAGSRADSHMQQQLRLLQEQLRHSQQQNEFLRELVRQQQLGNALSQAQIRELDRMGMLLGSTANNPPPPGRGHGRQLTAGVR
jgi:hypothetical protein